LTSSIPATSLNLVFIVFDVFNLPDFTAKGNHVPPFGIANFKTRIKITKNNNNGQTSERSVDRRDFSLNFTSTTTFHVIEIQRSPKEVPIGLLVSKTFTYCSIRVFFTVINEAEEPVSRYSYHLSDVSSSNDILVKIHALYCFKKSFKGTSLVLRTTSTLSPLIDVVLYN
jgi:hypothetical protein